MKTYLVLLDFLPGCEETFQNAVTIAEATNARLALLTVVQERFPYDGMGDGLTESREKVEALLSAARRSLNEYGVRARDFGLECNIYVLRGSLSYCIERQAAEIGADLIFVGTHGHGRLRKAVVGSTLEDLLSTAFCPIVVTPTKMIEKSGLHIAAP